MALEITIGYRGPLVEKVKYINARVKAAAQIALVKWQEESLPQHFKPLGQVNARYGGIFKARTRAYQVRKAKKFGHQNALQFDPSDPTSLSNNVRRNRVVVTGSKGQFRGRLPGSNKANFGGSQNRRHNGKSKSVTLPNMRDELTVMNQQELDGIAIVFRQEITNYLQPKPEDSVTEVKIN